MHWQFTPYVLPVIASAIVSTAVAVFLWRRRPAPGAIAFSLLMLAVAEWSLAYALELAGADLPTILFWDNFAWLGSAFAPTLWLIFALQYTGRTKWLTHRNIAILMVVPLVTLLGGSLRSEVAIYGSGGFTSYTDAQLERQLSSWTMQGIRMVKIKVGRDDIADLHRVYVTRNCVGNDVAVFVDSNGAYSRKQALAQAEHFAKYDVRWFEEPVIANDLEGLRLMRYRAPASMEIAAGEYGYDIFYFRRMLEAGAVDVLQADATRCGGFTGFLQVAELCNAHDTPLSAHTAPLLHTSVGCAVRPLRHLEYFHDHVRIERMLFDGVQVPQDGMLSPDRSRPGLGIELRRADAERYAA